ncbi:unnamed protein product, partial [Meganyctiphanes norvegica]
GAEEPRELDRKRMRDEEKKNEEKVDDSKSNTGSPVSKLNEGINSPDAKKLRNDEGLQTINLNGQEPEKKKMEVIQEMKNDLEEVVVDNKIISKLIENIDEEKDDNRNVDIQLIARRENCPREIFRSELHSSKSLEPSSRSWACCSSEGLLVYSLDNDWLFDPLQLDITNTPSAVKQKLHKKEYSTALMMAIRLNMKSLKQEVIESIPLDSVEVVVSSLSQLYVESLLSYIGEVLESSPHMGLYCQWAAALVTTHGQTIKVRSQHIMSQLNGLQRALTTHHTNLSKVCSHNEYMMKYLLAQSALRHKRLRKSSISLSGTVDDQNMADLTSDSESNPANEMRDMFEDEGIEA